MALAGEDQRLGVGRAIEHHGFGADAEVVVGDPVAEEHIARGLLATLNAPQRVEVRGANVSVGQHDDHVKRGSSHVA